MLTERQQRFADFYTENPNATRAAEAAGYSRRTAYSQGQRLLKNAEIAAYIRDRQEKAASERILSVNRARAMLSDIAESADYAAGTRLRALDLLLKTAGAQLPPPPAPPQDHKNGEEKPEIPENSDLVRIILPWTGDLNEPITAVELPDGSVVPLAGQEENDVLIYEVRPPRSEYGEDAGEKKNGTGASAGFTCGEAADPPMD